jgi:hypothetical protein
MIFAFTVTPPLPKCFSPSVVLCHVTKAAPSGPHSDSQHYPLAIKFLHNFFAPLAPHVARTQKVSQRTETEVGPNDVPKHPLSGNVNKTRILPLHAFFVPTT